jgi:hypothetical protein
MDVYGGWVLVIYAGLADDGALDRGGDWVVGDPYYAQGIGLRAQMHGGRIRIRVRVAVLGEEKTKPGCLSDMHFSDVDDLR